uniref:Peptidase S1 domain-containing protein n=1 Tax=Glossina brevipalpis TaxID=37001 RepID=A0A1A9X3Z8_9MUSC
MKLSALYLFVLIAGAIVTAKTSRSSRKRIVGGSKAEDGLAPYQVSLQYGWDSDHFCSGAIIGAEWILTAAHCVAFLQPHDVVVETGTQNLMEPGVYYNIKRIYTHCGYNEPLLHNDIALLHLNTSIVMNKKTQVIPLPVQAMDDDADVLLTGWGAIGSSGGNGVAKLKKINLKYVEYEHCKELLDNDPRLDVGNICTITRKGESACFGDSGGPLVSNGHLVGIVSWSNPCGLGFLNAHASPYFYLDWIHAGLKSYGDGEDIARVNLFFPKYASVKAVAVRVTTKPIRFPQSRIIRGNIAEEGLAPYQVSLQYEWANNHFCGGAIIDPEWILTAAHCVAFSQPQDLVVETGTQNLEELGVYYHVKRIYAHCGYNEPFLHNDIALLHLNSTIVMNRKTEIIPLPVEPMLDGDNILLTGWGSIRSSEDNDTAKLKKINLKYVKYERCKDLLHNDPRLDVGNICTATRKGKGSCFGDSGGPLVSNGHLVGIGSTSVNNKSMSKRILMGSETLLEVIKIVNASTCRHRITGIM